MAEHGGAIAAAVIAAVSTIAAALIQTGVVGGGDGGGDSKPPETTRTADNGIPPTTVTLPDRPMIDFKRPEIYLNRDSGPTGSTVLISGEGFAPNDKVTFIFHTTEMGRTQANAEGRFSNVSMKIPSGYERFAPGDFKIVADGQSPAHSAERPFKLTG